MFSDGSKSIEDLIQNGYSVDGGSYISRGWALFQKNAGGFIGFTLVIFLIGAAIAALPERLVALGNIISTVISGPLYAGFLIVAFKLLKERATTFGDFFRGFNNFLPFFIASLLVSIFVAIGMVLLIVPGVYLAVAYMLTNAFIVDRKYDFWQAMETSRKLVTRQWFGFFGFGLLMLLINIGGALLCGLGLLVTLPLTACAIAAAYSDIVGLSGASMADDM